MVIVSRFSVKTRKLDRTEWDKEKFLSEPEVLKTKIINAEV